MKGDFTRFTFDAAKHNRSVLMQQGRVQIDADFNEQQDLTIHRVETETGDVVGLCGAPMHHAGFQVVPKPGTPAAARAPRQTKPSRPTPTGDLLIMAGRYYVDGILCENEHDLAYTEQAQLDLPDAVAVTDPGTYLAYLDVWNRHITALEDPGIREVALGGPDTATRERIVWQVKLFRLGEAGMDIPCSQASPWANVKLAAPGGLAARTSVGAPSKDPCIVAPGAGYRRLENQLYRVEVHTGGLLKSATFKWSRDNGSIVTRWESQDGNNLTVSSIGRDKVLSFASGQWVELTDDTRELLGQPGTLVQLVKAEGRVLTINPGTATDTVALSDFKRNPKVRAWNSPGAPTIEIPATNSGWLQLEDGVEIKFTQGRYTSGDYWTIPARTAIADVEWPKDPATNLPATRLPAGIQHHYCNLALLSFKNGVWTKVRDCRCLFPSLTQVNSLYYVSGDGQEVMPDLTLAALDGLVPLPRPLVVGVVNPQCRDQRARVRFNVLSGRGFLFPRDGSTPGTTVDMPTDDGGLAACDWHLDSANWSQQVEATLLDADNNPIHLPIRFNANLSVADQVAYDPAQCGSLQGKKTVQDAIKTISELVSLYQASGDTQCVLPGEELAPLVVVASSKCGPVQGMKVLFSLVRPEGKLEQIGEAKTDAEGLASFDWKIEASPAVQVVEAELMPDDDHPTVPPTRVRFTAILSVADHVAYDPKICSTLKDQKTVQQAIDRVVAVASLYPASETNFTLLPNQAGPFQLQVVASSKCGPVSGMPVTFKVITAGGGQVNPPTPVPTDVNGLASCSWTPGAALGTQIVEAALQANADHPTVPPTIVRFTAQRAVVDDPGFHVTGLFLLPPPGQVPLVNNTEVEYQNLDKGIRIDCSEKPDPLAVDKKPVVFVTLERPIPFPVTEGNTVVNTVGSYQPLVLPGAATADSNAITWLPDKNIFLFLQSIFDDLRKLKLEQKVLARLTAKGNFIWASGSFHYLDGEAFGVPPTVRALNDLLFLGDQKRGGDLEMWFWLVPTSFLKTLTLEATTVTGTQGSIGTVSLSKPAPSGGLVVDLSGSDSAAAVIPASVTVKAANTSATFDIPTKAVQSLSKVAVTASQGRDVLMARLTVESPKINSLKLEPDTVVGPRESAGTVGLNGPAPKDGIVVTLSIPESKVATVVPVSVTVPAGATSTGFKILTQSVSSTQNVVVTASQGGTVLTAPLTVTIEPPRLNLLTLKPNTITGNQGSIGTVGLTGPAPTGGIVVTLSSSDPKLASVPGSVKIAAGLTSTTFNILTIASKGTLQVVITASQGGNVVKANLMFPPTS